MPPRSALLSSIAAKLADYRTGEIPQIDVGRVDRWVRQFDPAVQAPILAEMDHVFDHMYCTRIEVVGFLQNLVMNPNITKGKPQSGASAERGRW